MKGESAWDKTTPRRITIRATFDVYEDQMDALKDLQYEGQAQHPMSLSAMVREAIDDYIKKRRKK
jgi:hypothetical protein